MKHLFLGTALAGALAIGAGVGTYSWFTSETNANGTLVTGTFSLGEMEQLFDHQAFAPSQLLFSDWQTINNTGDMDQVLRATYSHQLNKEVPIEAYKVGFTALKYTEKPDEDELQDQIYELEKLFEGTTNPLNPYYVPTSGVEVMSGILSADQVKALSEEDITSSQSLTLGEDHEFWTLEADEYIDIVFGVKLSDTAGNEYQGAQYDAEFKVEAKQTDNGAEF